jgi:hypothetical protein
LRARDARSAADIAILASHRKPIEEWDTEELARGRPRDRNGKFSGAPPKWITPALVIEAKRRLQLQAFGDLSVAVGDAVKAVHKIITSSARDDEGRPLVSTRDRLDAAKFVIEMVLGKAKQRVDLEAGDNLKAMLAGALVMPDGRPFIEGTAWESDEEEADDDDE